MNDRICSETAASDSTSPSGSAARLVRRTFAALNRNWHDTLYLERRLLDAQRPWEQSGPLRWQPAPGGWRVVGAYLPDDGATRPTASRPTV
jgi:hypothetical protein